MGSLTGPQPRQNQGLSTHGKQMSRQKTQPMNAKVAGDRSQWWLIGLAHLGLLLEQVCLQEALILDCGQFQIMLEVFKPRGGRQLGHRSVGDLPCQLLSSHQLYSAAQCSITSELGSFTPCFLKDKTAPEFLFSPLLKLLEIELKNTPW